MSFPPKAEHLPANNGKVQTGLVHSRTIALSVPALLFLGLFAIFNSNGGIAVGADCRPNVHLPLAVLKYGKLSFTAREMPFMFIWKVTLPEGSRDIMIWSWRDRAGPFLMQDLLDRGALTVVKPMYYLTPTIRADEHVSIFGIGAGLTALPVYWFAQLLGYDLESSEVVWRTAKYAASSQVALSCVFVYWSCLRWMRRPRAIIIALALGLGTCVWPISSQSLWQHGANEFYLSAAILCLTRISRNWLWAAGCGAALGAAVLCRPDSAVVAVAVGLYVVIARRRAAPAFVSGALPLLVGFVIYNLHYFGTLLAVSQARAGELVALEKTGVANLWQTPLATGLMGILLSPSRGLFVFSPFLLFALWGAASSWKDRRWSELRPLSIAVVIIWCINARHFDWWSGWSFGYRHIVDTSLLLCILIAPIIEHVVRKRLLLGVFAMLLTFSIGVQFLGAMAYDVGGWSGRKAFVVQVPGEQDTRVMVDRTKVDELIAAQNAQITSETIANIDRPEFRHRLWDWKDSQIIYYLTHFRESRRAMLELTAKWVRAG